MVKVGSILWHRRGRSILETFNLFKDSGFDGVEVTVSEKESSIQSISDRGYLRIEKLEDDCKRLRSASRSVELEIHSVRSGLLWKYPLTSEEPRVRKTAEKIVEKELRAASKLEADALLVVPGVVTESISYDEAYRLALSALKRLSRVAEEENIYIAIENVENNFLLSPLEMKNFIEDIGSEKVGVYLDIGNILKLKQAYPQHWINILSEHIRKVHVKDYNRRLNSITYLFQGDVNWPEVIRVLKEKGYNDYLTAELPPYRMFPEIFFRDLAEKIRVLIEL